MPLRSIFTSQRRRPTFANEVKSKRGGRKEAGGGREIRFLLSPPPV